MYRADVQGKNFLGCNGLTDEQLEKAETFAGALLPNGTVFSRL
jgi:hypothetical protein